MSAAIAGADTGAVGGLKIGLQRTGGGLTAIIRDPATSPGTPAPAAATVTSISTSHEAPASCVAATSVYHAASSSTPLGEAASSSVPYHAMTNPPLVVTAIDSVPCSGP